MALAQFAGADQCSTGVAAQVLDSAQQCDGNGQTSMALPSPRRICCIGCGCLAHFLPRLLMLLLIKQGTNSMHAGNMFDRPLSFSSLTGAPPAALGTWAAPLQAWVR